MWSAREGARRTSEDKRERPALSGRVCPFWSTWRESHFFHVLEAVANARMHAATTRGADGHQNLITIGSVAQPVSNLSLEMADMTQIKQDVL